MLIINADDFGRDGRTTDRSLDCFQEGLITSGSAMVFMSDSLRASDLAKISGLVCGLHLNFSLPFDGPEIDNRLLEIQYPIARYLLRGKWPQVVYNPLLINNVDYLYKAQYDEFCRIYNTEPDKIDGHRHMHLCMNMLLKRVVPYGYNMRRSFSFGPGERGLINRIYRRCVDTWVARHYRTSDFFFDIAPIHDQMRLKTIIALAGSNHVELMVHPAEDGQYLYLKSADYKRHISSVKKGTYRMLHSIR